ncbi:MAG: hypothetical protein N2Z74_04550 [Syntrophales bacterium]|nr:hypothetical protein [Syntrophales bacterium]
MLDLGVVLFFSPQALHEKLFYHLLGEVLGWDFSQVLKGYLHPGGAAMAARTAVLTERPLGDIAAVLAVNVSPVFPVSPDEGDLSLTKADIFLCYK